MRRRWSLPWSRLCLGHLWEPGGQSRRLRSLNVSENGIVAPKSVAFRRGNDDSPVDPSVFFTFNLVSDKPMWSTSTISLSNYFMKKTKNF